MLKVTKLKSVIFLLVIFSCSPKPTAPQNQNLPHPGMIKVLSAGKSFQQGWNDTNATLDERPGMVTTFTYDYWLDSTDVTRQHYFDLTGKSPVPVDSQYGVGNDYPVCFVSWFDAVLFCNARSRAEKLDTVYSYSGVQTQPNGSVYALTGLLCDITRDGYRLPTESELEFAARGGTSANPFSVPADSISAKEYAWYSSNSGGRLQPVATKPANTLGFYDLAGNVFEWTNDWKQAYNGMPITNSLGGLQPDNAYEKVIKGGAYDYDMMYLRPSIRSATYSTTLSALCDYVGFRCTRGPIPNGQYIGASVQSISPNPVTIIASTDTLWSFLGTVTAKIVFVNVTGNNRTLCVVDFNTALPYVRQFLDDSNVYAPTISPDGHFAAYCSRNVGLSGPSSITIRSLDSLNSPKILLSADSAYFPHWWINPATADTCIVYTNSAVDDGSSLWGATTTLVQKVSAGKPISPPQVLVASGSFHDGVSVNGSYIVTGYTELIMRNLLTNNNKRLFLSPNNGKNADGSSQVCNVSISPDTGNNVRCLFLDFGYSGTSTVTGTSYGIHQYLFEATPADSIVNFMHCPASEASWDNPSWTNTSYFAVACVRNSSNQAHAIHLVNLSADQSIVLLSGTELEQPYCWVGAQIANPGNYLALDSLGLYDDPEVESDQEVMTYKMHLFWKHCNNVNLVFLGNSLTELGIDCSVFKDYKAINMAFTGMGIQTETILLKNYILNHAPNLKLVGIPVPLFFFDNQSGDATPTYFTGAVGQSRGYIYDSIHAFWNNGLPVGFLQAMATISDSAELAENPWDSLGDDQAPCDGWGGTANLLTSGTATWTVADTIYQQNFIAFENMIQMLSARHIHLLAINTPESPYYKNSAFYQAGNISWPAGQAVMEQVTSLQTKYPYFHVYDAYQNGNNDYTDADAYNSDHLCPTGAQKLTVRLDSLIQGILNN